MLFFDGFGNFLDRFFMKRGGRLSLLDALLSVVQLDILVAVNQPERLEIIDKVCFCCSFPDWRVIFALYFLRQSLIGV